MKQRLETHYRQHANLLFNKYGRATNSKQDGEDIVHNAYERALKYIYSFNEELNFDAWMSTILTNSLRDFKGDLGGLVKTIDPDMLQAIYYPHTVDFEKSVKKYTDRLNDQHKEVIRLHCDFGYNPKEINEVSPLSGGHIRTIISRFRLHMREYQC